MGERRSELTYANQARDRDRRAIRTDGQASFAIHSRPKRVHAVLQVSQWCRGLGACRKKFRCCSLLLSRAPKSRQANIRDGHAPPSRRLATHPEPRSSVTKRKFEMATKIKERAVVVTTSHRGVFFGYTVNTGGAIISLRAARNCLRWSEDVKGFMGLASSGPTANCRIGPAADIELRDITSVMNCTPVAVAAWEKAPWTR